MRLRFFWCKRNRISLYNICSFFVFIFFSCIYVFSNIAAPDTHPQEITQPQKRANIKKQICKSILGATYFKMYKQEWVDLDNEEIRSELKEHYGNIFDKIFERSDSSSSSFRYENMYQLREIQIKSTYYKEFGFICPVRGTESHKVEEFIVSREYDVNLVDEYYPIAGRFIFAPNDVNKFTLLALAEESGTELIPWFVRNSLIGNLFNLTERYNEDLFATLSKIGSCMGKKLEIWRAELSLQRYIHLSPPS